MVPLSCLCEALLLIPSTDKTQTHLFALSENTKYVKSELFGAKKNHNSFFFFFFSKLTIPND